LSADAETRRACFDLLVAGPGRALWSVEALRLLCHPLRAAEAMALLEPGLAQAGRLRERGDIFLPRQWLAALFNGHGTADAAAAIRTYLARHALPAQFTRLVLQTADPVFRAARSRGAD
jgi:aminopeptidase N